MTFPVTTGKSLDLLLSTAGTSSQNHSLKEPEPLPGATPLFFPSLSASPCHIEFPGQGSDLSGHRDLNHSCRYAGSFTHCARLGIKPLPQRSQDAAADPIGLQPGTPRNLLDQPVCILHLQRRRWGRGGGGGGWARTQGGQVFCPGSHSNLVTKLPRQAHLMPAADS